MNDNKDDKPDSEKDPLSDSMEMFDSIFKEESSDENAGPEKAKAAPVVKDKRKAAKKPVIAKKTTGVTARSAPLPNKTVAKPKAAVQKVTVSKKKTVKEIKQPAPKKPEIHRKAAEPKGAKTVSRDRSPKKYITLKILLACVLLAVLAFVFVMYSGIVDYKILFRSSEMSEQKRITKSIPSEKAAVKVPDTVPLPIEKPEIQKAAPPIEEKPALVEKSKPTPPPQAKEGLVEKEISYPYSIYLGSFSDLKGTQKAVSSYQKTGLSPYWIKIDLGEKGVWFRLFAGYFEKRDLADAYIKENKIKGAESRKTIYANFTGSYESEYDLNTKSLALTELGYSPYVIPGTNGVSRLYTGAFYQKVRAEKQNAELLSKGIQSQVVKR